MKLNLTLISNLLFLVINSTLAEQASKIEKTSSPARPKSTDESEYFQNYEKNLQELVDNFSDTPVRRGPTRVRTNLQAGNSRRAYEYGAIAAAAYCTDGSINSWSCRNCGRYGKLDIVKVMNDRVYETKGFIGIDKNKKVIVLSFRGSSNLVNWIQNIKFGLVPLFNNSENIRVHQGFKEAVESLSRIYTPVVGKLLKDNPTFKLGIVGHSLGGAIASLAAINLKNSQNLPWERIELYTYGQPRVGNTDFAAWFDSLKLTVARVVNDNDITPHLPPRTFGYNHHHIELWLADGRTRVCSTQTIEDEDCSLSTEPFLSMSAHHDYFDYYLGGTCH